MIAEPLRSVRNLLIAPRAVTAAATASASLDTVTTRGKASWAVLNIAFASEVNTSAVGATLSLLHSDDTVVTNHATMIANRTDEDCVAAKLHSYHIDLRGKKRYIRLTITSATHTTNDVNTISADYELLLGQEPASTSDMGGTVTLVG